MGHLDDQVVLFLNQVVHRWWTLDTLLFLCSSSPLLRGGVTATLIWWVWFKQGEQQRRSREILLFGIVGCVCAVWLARLVSHLAPFRARPLHNPELNLHLAEGLSRKLLLGWSSFPSDHAALFVCLAVCLWLASRKLGIIATAEVLVVVCLPRLVLGIHYPSDVLGGASIGASVALLARSAKVGALVTGRALAWADRSPQLFYASLFFATYMIGVVFDPLVPLFSWAAVVIRTASSRMNALVGVFSVSLEWIPAAAFLLVFATLMVFTIGSVRLGRSSHHAPLK